MPETRLAVRDETHSPPSAAFIRRRSLDEPPQFVRVPLHRGLLDRGRAVQPISRQRLKDSVSLHGNRLARNSRFDNDGSGAMYGPPSDEPAAGDIVRALGNDRTRP